MLSGRHSVEEAVINDAVPASPKIQRVALSLGEHNLLEVSPAVKSTGRCIFFANKVEVYNPFT